MPPSPEALQEASEHILATANAFVMEGHVTAELDGNPNDQQILSRRLQAWDLRIDGYTYRQIGERLGIHASTAYIDVQSAAALLDDYRRAKAERLLDVELARLDKVRKIAQDDAVDKNNSNRHRAQLAFARLSEVKNKMLGLNAPERVLHAGMVITGEQLAGSRGSLAEKLEGLRQRMLGEGQGVAAPEAGQGGGVHDAQLCGTECGTAHKNSQND